MRRTALRALGLCLGVVVYLGVIGALPSKVSALELPSSVLKDLGDASEHFHPPPLRLPHVDVPPSVVSKFGATDAATIAALEADETGEGAIVSAEAKTLSTDEGEREGVRQCAEKGLLAILEEILEKGERLTFAEAAEKGLTPCFDEFVPQGEQARAVIEYFAKQEAEETGIAYTHAGNNPIVLGNWLRSTAASVHPTSEPEPQPPAPSGTEPSQTSSDTEGGLSSGAIAAIVVIVVVVAAALFFGYRAMQRRGRP